MAEEPLHPLKQWRVARGYTMEAAAAMLGTWRQTWHDWECGRRIPDRRYMPAVYLLTEGEVRPDHFYDLPAIGCGTLQLDAGAVPLFDAVADGKSQQSNGCARALEAAW